MEYKDYDKNNKPDLGRMILVEFYESNDRGWSHITGYINDTNTMFIGCDGYKYHIKSIARWMYVKE